MSYKFDYYYFPKVLSKKEINDLNNFIIKNSTGLEEKEDTASKNGVSIKNTKTYLINYGKIQDKLNSVIDLFNETNNEIFGYNIYPFTKLTKVLLNIYDSKIKGEYPYHCDVSKSDVFDCKLTILVNLSKQKYEGGEFFIFNGEEYKVPELNEPGNMIIMRSYLNHKVSPVTKGIRTSLTMFGLGPKFI